MNRKVFVGSIPVGATKKKILDYFAEKSDVVNFSIIVKKKNKNFICGILQCVNEASAKRILGGNHWFMGNQLECHPFMRGNKLKSYKHQTTNRNVYVANIPYNCKKYQILEIFECFGKIEKIRFLHSHKYKEKYCIVTFEREEVVDRIIKIKKISGFGGLIKVKRFRGEKERKKGKSEFSPQYEGKYQEENYVPKKIKDNQTPSNSYNQNELSTLRIQKAEKQCGYKNNRDEPNRQIDLNKEPHYPATQSYQLPQALGQARVDNDYARSRFHQQESFFKEQRRNHIHHTGYENKHAGGFKFPNERSYPFRRTQAKNSTETIQELSWKLRGWRYQSCFSENHCPNNLRLNKLP